MTIENYIIIGESITSLHYFSNVTLHETENLDGLTGFFLNGKFVQATDEL